MPALIVTIAACLGVLAPAAAQAAPDPDVEPVTVVSATQLPPLQDHRPIWVAIDPFTCPTDHPWLASRPSSEYDTVPRGVEVDRGRSVLVMINGEATVDEETGYVTGWGAGANRTANLHPTEASHLTLTAHCTDNPDRAYRDGDRDRS